MQLATDWRAADLSEQDYAMLEYVEKVSLAAASCTEEDVARLRAVGFRDEEILDVVVLTAYRHFITRVADALGCELRGELLGDQRIVAALATGKPAPAPG